MGSQSFGLDEPVVVRVAREIKQSGVRDYAQVQRVPDEATGREDR